jgi:hypothetical protein
MWISPALAHGMSGSHGTSGGGKALLLLIAIGITVLLLSHAKKKWLARNSMPSEE